MEIERFSFPNRKKYSKDYFKTLYQKYPEGLVVAEKERKILGYIVGEIENRVPAKRVGKFISLAVAPDFRKMGVGRKLVNFLINHFKKKRVKEISLHVRAKNKLNLSFYKKLGFKKQKEIKNYYQNGDSAFLMKKEI